MNNILKFQNLSNYKKTFVYMFEDGDTVKDIANRFHTTERVIIADNSLTEEPKSGQYIMINVIDGEKYIVKPYDTLYSISGYNKEKMTDIMNKNKIDSVFVGQVLYI